LQAPISVKRIVRGTIPTSVTRLKYNFEGRYLYSIVIARLDRGIHKIPGFT